MKSKIEPFKVAIIQQAPVFLNLNQSIKRAETLVKYAVLKDVKIIVFPESWLCGYPIWLDFAPKAALWDHLPAKKLYRLLVENSLAVFDEHFTRLQSLAQKNSVYIIMGSHERVKNTLFNSLIIFHKNGKDFHIHRKLIPTYTEKLIWGRGDGSSLGILKTEFGNIGGLICWEHWMPFARAYMHSLSEMIHIAQWPAVNNLHQIASRHYAFEGQCYVISAGCIVKKGDLLEGIKSHKNFDNSVIELIESIPGSDNELIHNGGSSIIGPDSNYMTGPGFNGEKVIFGIIDPQKTVWGNLFMDTDGHYSRPDIFALKVNTAKQNNILGYLY